MIPVIHKGDPLLRDPIQVSLSPPSQCVLRERYNLDGPYKIYLVSPENQVSLAQNLEITSCVTSLDILNILRCLKEKWFLDSAMHKS
jgi:hypothetical protein